MKTEFNVERVCERVHMCYVEAPEELGHPLIEVRNGSIHVSFPQFQPVAVQPVIEAAVAVPTVDPANDPANASLAKSGKRRGK